MIAHLQGLYVRDAIDSTICNAFRDKQEKPKYPQKPYPLFEENRELTEEEKQREVELFFAQQDVMRANFQMAHKNKGSE